MTQAQNKENKLLYLIECYSLYVVCFQIDKEKTRQFEQQNHLGNDNTLTMKVLQTSDLKI